MMEAVPFSEIGEVVAGQGAPRESAFGADGLPFIRAGHLDYLVAGGALYELPRISPADAKTFKLKVLPERSVVFAKSGMSAGKDRVVITDQEAYFVSHLAAIIPCKDFDAGYIKYFLQWYRPSRLIVDESYPSISLRDIGKVLLPYRPLPTQRRIAGILDKAQALAANDKRTLALYDQLAKSVFLEMFGDPVRNEREWEKVTMDSVATKVTDGEHATPRRSEQGYLLLSARNVKNRFIDLDAGVDFVEKNEFERIVRRCDPEPGDILISCSGTNGRTTKVRLAQPFVLVRSVALVKPDKKRIDADYLEQYLLSDYMQATMMKSAKSSSQANLFTGPIKELPVLLPPMKEQMKWQTAIRRIDSQRAQIETSLRRSEGLFGSLLQGAFGGELV